MRFADLSDAHPDYIRWLTWLATDDVDAARRAKMEHYRKQLLRRAAK